MVSTAFGIDFGGSRIKGAPVDLELGDFAADQTRIMTPEPSTPEAIATVFAEVLGRYPGSGGPVSVTVPGVVQHGANADALFTEATGLDVHVVNDADAAGLAEARYGTAAGDWGSSPRSAPGSAPRWCTTAYSCPTPSSATSRSTATTPSGARP